MAHTKGPWRVKLFRVKSDIYSTYRAGSIEPNICEMVSSLPCDEVSGNARLIAAAPDLLEACEDVLDLLSKCPTVTKEGVPYPSGMWVNKLVAAINKAKGE